MRKKTWIAIAALAAIAAGAYAYSEYGRRPRQAGDMKASTTITAHELHAAFFTGEEAATARYVGSQAQAILVTGTIRTLERGDAGGSVILATADEMAGVVCEFAAGALPDEWQVGQEVRVQGICTGMNDLIPDVIMVRCVEGR